MKLREVAPIGHHRGHKFTMRSRGSLLDEVITPIYPVSWHGNLLARTRKERGLGLHDAAIKIGVRAVEVSRLERGRLVPEDSSEWPKMLEALTR